MKASKLALLLSLALLSAGAALARGVSSSPPAPRAATAPPSQTTAALPTHVGAAEARAPLSFALRSRDGASPLEQIVSVEIQPRGALPYPVKLSLALPRDAHLLDGQAEEQLHIEGAEPILREMRVRLARPWTLDDPLRVTLHGESKATGLHGDKQLPPRPELTVPRLGAPPPLGRPAPR